MKTFLKSLNGLKKMLATDPMKNFPNRQIIPFAHAMIKKLEQSE